MRVGLVIYGELDTPTGGYLYDRMLVEHLTAAGDDVEVISLPWRSYGRHLCDNASPSLARRLDGARFDVLLQDELNHPSLVVTNRRRRNRDACPVVAVVHVLRASEHADSRLRSLYAAAERRYLGSVDGAVYASEATRSAGEALAGAGLPGVVAHPGGDHLGGPATDAEVVARAREGGPLRVLSVANATPTKRLDCLIEALARLSPDAWRLTIVGSLERDPACAAHLRQLIRDAGVGANVELAGAVANCEVPTFLARSDLLVVASSYESFGIAYLEAMRFGVPVIATAAGGAGELVEHGREGFLVVPGDVDALAGHLARLTDDRALLLEMGLAALRRAERHPSWERSMSRVRTFLLSSASEHRLAREQAS